MVSFPKIMAAGSAGFVGRSGLRERQLKKSTRPYPQLQAAVRQFSSSQQVLHQAQTDSPQVILLGIPSDTNSSFLRGAAKAPPFIRKALHSDSSNTWSESPSMDIVEHPKFVDGGHITELLAEDELASGHREKVFEKIQKKISQLVDQENARVLSLGGDRFITYPIIAGYAKKYNNDNPLTILQLDAHPDLHHNIQDNPYSHASPFARILEDGSCTSSSVARLIQVGIRTMDDHQLKQAQKFGNVEVVTMKTLEELKSDAMLATIRGIRGPLYLSLCLDVLDPAFCPGLSHPEPGGMSTRQVIQMIHAIKAPLVGADIVEYNPNLDTRDMSARVAAKLVKEIAAKMLST